MPLTAEKIRKYLRIKNRKWEYIEKIDNIKLNDIFPLFERK
mgnify:FL=1